MSTSTRSVRSAGSCRSSPRRASCAYRAGRLRRRNNTRSGTIRAGPASSRRGGILDVIDLDQGQRSLDGPVGVVDVLAARGVPLTGTPSRAARSLRRRRRLHRRHQRRLLRALRRGQRRASLARTGRGQRPCDADDLSREERPAVRGHRRRRGRLPAAARPPTSWPRTRCRRPDRLASPRRRSGYNRALSPRPPRIFRARRPGARAGPLFRRIPGRMASPSPRRRA